MHVIIHIYMYNIYIISYIYTKVWITCIKQYNCTEDTYGKSQIAQIILL